MEFFHFICLSWKDLIDDAVNIIFLNLIISYGFVPSWSIIFMFGMFLADFKILDLEFLSDIIREFFNLDFSKKLLNSLVFLISFLKSSTTKRDFDLIFCESSWNKPSCLIFLLTFLTL